MARTVHKVEAADKIPICGILRAQFFVADTGEQLVIGWVVWRVWAVRVVIILVMVTNL